MRKLLPTALLMAQSMLVASLAAAWTVPAVMLGAARALATPPRR